MKTVILYKSKHHGNTKKLVDAIAAAHPDDVTLIDVAALGKNEYPDLTPYHCIGAASGIYYGELDKDLKRVLDHCLRPQDKVFGIITYGGSSKWYGRDLAAVCQVKFANLMCIHGCLGLDTWGPFKFKGGVNQGHPDEADIQGAVDFYDKFERDYGEIFEEEYAKREKRLAFEAAHPRGGLFSNIKRSAQKIARKVRKS